jgi:diguanylate cyclase (GGDEF)-like protein
VSVSREQIERALESAKQDNNQSAVSELQGMLESQPAVPAGYQPGALSTEVGGIDAPPLSQPTATESDIDSSLQARLNPEPAQPKPMMNDRERGMAQETYDADMELVKSGAAKPTQDQLDEFMGAKMGNTPWTDPLGRQVVVDQKTGKARWSALSPDQMEESLRRKDRGSTTKATAGAIGYGATRVGGALLGTAEAEISQNNAFQQFLLTGDKSLPKSEQDRIMGLAREKYGDDVDPGSIPAGQVKKWIDMNPENDLAFRNIAGDEWWEERKEFAARLGNRISSVVPRMPVNLFGADDPIGALTGQDAYEGIDYTGKREPSFPGASEMMQSWESDADKGTGIYEGVILPLVKRETGKSPALHAEEFSEGFIDKYYDEEQLAEREMPIFSGDVEINSLGDILNSDLYTDPNSKLMNPEALFLMFMENAPELGVSFAVTRGAGAAGARVGARGAYGQTVERMNKARETAAGRSGMLAGGATEGVLVQTHVENETRKILDQIPIEQWESNESFLAMVEAGLTPEGAKQVLTQEKASKAGTSAAVVTMLSGAPMNRLMARSAAGELMQKNVAARRTVGALGEPLTEGGQEVMEMLQTEAAVRPIDPDNPIFADPNRYYEAFGGGALISTPFGISGVMQPGAPVGIDKADLAAIRSTSNYMKATNERFKYETMLSDPEHIADTSPNERLAELNKLEKLQLVESESILKAEPSMRKFLQKQNTRTAEAELKMLNRLVMRANAMKNDIAVARSKRTTAMEMRDAEREVMTDRAELQKKVNDQVIKLEDIQSLTAAIESVQELGSVSPEQEQSLIKEGYARRSKEGQLVILPKGRRATKELNRQARGLQDRLEKGFTGDERRQGENLLKRDLVDSAGPVERESMLYQDNLTGAQNRRAFNERQEHIDVREGDEKIERVGAAPAIAAVDVDSLAWVNDNMTHSSGDRLLVAVSDALSKQKGVEVFRLGGDEFAVTAASQEALETAMQAAAAELTETEIIAGEDVVTPQITWGKGETYAEADAESLTMKDDRTSRGITAKRKEKAATYRHRAQQGLFQLDSEAALPRYWHRVRGQVERGDSVEVLTPDGAVQGVVTKVTNKRDRPRLTVNIQGKDFLFNPRSNHLIIPKTMSPSDLAWITGDAEYAQPDRDTFPQVLSDVQIGHLGKDGNWYADLADDFEYESPTPWWQEMYPQHNFHPQVPFMPKEMEALPSEIAVAETVKESISDGMGNMPEVHIVKSISWLKKNYPSVVEQIRDELVASGGSGSFSGVRGYMDHINPENGVFIFPAHIGGIVGGETYEQNVLETVYHEVIGHWGVRGTFGHEAALRPFMNEIVDAFPRLSDFYSSTLSLDKNNPEQKQVLGEEMVAYLAGQVKAGKISFNDKQRNLWQRFIAWIKEFMVRRRLDRFSPVKKMVTLHDSKEVFWNDDRVQDLLAHSRNFVRHANGISWTPLSESVETFMRDGEMFQAGFITAMKTATFKPSNREKNELAKRYGGKENVPSEVPMFPDDASPNAWKQLIIKAQKDNWMTGREIELSGLSDKANFSLFRDGTYGTLERYMRQLNNGFMMPRWYQGIVPADVAAELDAINDAIEKNHIEGPLAASGSQRGETGLEYEIVARPSVNEVSAELMRTRIAEIMSQKMNPKKTRLTKELMMAHMLSENAYRVFVEKQGGHPGITLTQAQEKLFGTLTTEEVDALTNEQMQMVKDEVKRTRDKGYDIGYDRDTDRWLDWAAHTTEYSEWSPQGSRTNRDFRVTLIKSEGAGGEMGYTGHYDPNIMHVRTGVAELLNWDGMPELEYPNPAMKGQMLSLIELQSDWLQKLRKGFSSRGSRDEATESAQEKRTLLNMVGDQLGRGISEDVWAVVESSIMPIIDLTDGTTGKENDSSPLFAEMQQLAVTDTGNSWETLSPDQKREVWKKFTVQKFDLIRENFTVARNRLIEYADSMPKITDLAGSMDARAFQALDAYAAKRVSNAMLLEFERLTDRIQNNLRYADTQVEMEAFRDIIQRNHGKAFDRLASNSDYDEGLRLPMAEYLLRPMLEITYDAIGADETKVAERMSGLKTREMATVRVPNTVLLDLNTAMTGRWDPVHLMNEMMSASRISRHSDIAPGGLSLTAVSAGDEFVDVKVVGNKADVSKAQDLIPKLIETWVEDHGAEKRSINIRERANRTISQDVDGDYSFSELESEFDLEEEDTSGEQTEAMRDEGVESFYSFEEDQLSDIEMELVNYAFENMSEGDWDEQEQYHEGVSRQGDTYRGEVEIDADGDVDNADAEDNLNEARDEYRTDVLFQDDDIRQQASDQLREQWDERGETALIKGQLPIAWDEDGNSINSVEIMIRAQDPGDAYDMYIDGSEEDYESDLETAKENLSNIIKEYYRNESIRPPPGAFFGPSDEVVAEREEQTEDSNPPNWDIVKGNISENLSMMSDQAQKMDKVYEELVVLNKRLSYGEIHKESPVGKDEQWRPLALKYLISDAVRRGLGGVMWNNGLSSSTRGGMGQSGVRSTERITWSKEKIGIRGEEQEVYVIRYAESVKPMVVSRNSMIPVLGSDVARLIYMQENGKLEVPSATPTEVAEAPSARDGYIVADTDTDTRAIYRRSTNGFVGFASSEEAIDTLISNDRIHNPDTSTMAGEQAMDTAEPLGEVVSKGVIDEAMAGGKIHVMVGDRTRSYAATFSRPRLAGARQSYEDITVRMWNKELKKYGVHISDTFVKAKDMNKAMTEEGQASMKSPKRDAQIAEEHGRLYLAEVTGGMHNWVVMSEKKGPVVNDVFTDRDFAQTRLTNYIEENFGSDAEGVQVMYFPINEKMREEFSGPVAPFHYDPTQDPAMKSAAEKIGYKKKPLRERFNEWRMGARAEATQGALDQFHGLKKALNEAGQSDGAYISARLTTSLESMMKAVLNYGHPVWKDGIVQNEGKGLLDIFQPILNDPDTWGLYMAGKRAKGLMMEGYASLEPEMRAKIDAAAKQFGTGPDSVFEVLVKYQAMELYDHVEVQAGDLTNSERASLSKIESKFWADFLPHTKRDMQPKKGSTTKAPGGRWQIFDWRVPSQRNTQKNIDSKYRMATKALMGRGYKVKSEADARKIVDRLTDLALTKQQQSNAMREVRVQSSKAAAAVISNGREHLFEAPEIKSMAALGDKFQHFKRVAKDYAAFNKKMLDFAVESGIIDPEGRSLWENADYVPFYRVDDNRLSGSGMSPTAGIANQRSPIRRLRGADNRMGDIMGNIMMNMTKLVDASVKNNAAVESVDALRGSGIISKKPMEWKPEMIPMSQMKKVLIDKGVIVAEDKEGIHLSDIPEEALTGMQKMFAMKAPEGDGVISIMRDGKREYYYTDDMLLYRSMASINKKHFGAWMALFSAPKRLLTTMITIDPAFMISNFIRDTGSAFVIGRDKGNLPVLSAIKGFNQALLEDETMRTLVGAGSAFENGYITAGDPRKTKKMLKAAMKKRSFVNSVLDSPFKLGRAWLHLGSSIENSNRIAVYNAAIAAGKSKKQAVFEAKDLMDFSMGGDYPTVRFLIQSVPFMNARAQGTYRLGRGMNENPKSFSMKGMLVGLAGMALYLSFKDDPRYEALEIWDKQAYFHWWIGDVHYRLPKPFEVGAIFNTIPEMFVAYAYNKETDDGKTLMKEFGHMIAQTFSMSPVPQTIAPLREMNNNWNYFTKRPIVSYYEEKRLPPDQYRTRTSPTFIELAKRLPSGLDTVSGKIRSPLHLQNLYAGYTGTIGRYMLQGADWITERALDYPLPPSPEIQDYAVLGRFMRGDNPPRRTKYETEVYKLLEKTTMIQGSLSFHEKSGNVDEYLSTNEEYLPYIQAAEALNTVRENIQEVNKAIMAITKDPEKDRDLKQKEIDELEETRNFLFKEGWKLRPGGEYNPKVEPVTENQIMDLIDNWGVDTSVASRIKKDAPDTHGLLEMVNNDMSKNNLTSLARVNK